VGDEASQQVRRKAAAYGRLPSVWPAEPPEPPGPPFGRFRAVLALLRTVSTAAVLVAGPPVALWWLFGNPLDLLPSGQQVSQWFTDAAGLPSGVLRPIVAWLLWLLWAAVVVLLLGSLVTVVAGWRLPMWRLPAPLHRLVFGVAGTAVITLVNTPYAAPAGPPAATQPAQTSTPRSLGEAVTGVARGPVMVQVGDLRYQYVVERGDTLSKVARDWLGDADRWPEICDLNRHRHFPHVSGRLTDCDLIYPGWQLRLPADATPPAGTKPQPRHEPRTPAEPDAADTTPPNGSPTPASTGIHPEPATTGPAPSTPAASGNSSTTGAGDQQTPAADTGISSDDEGITLPGGSFIPWTLAAAIAAAAAMVWLQRRRRYRPSPDDLSDDEQIVALSAPVVAVQQQLHRRGPQPTTAETAAPQAVPPLLPPGGVGLVGDGARGAARALIISALSAGRPEDPDQQAEVITDHATLTELFGQHASAITPWRRLHVARDLEHALAMLDSRLLHRARVLDEHSLTDLDRLRQRAPDEEALPPVLFVGQAASAAATMRARITFGLSDGLDTSAVLLGAWPYGSTITVTPDGHTATVEGPPVEAIDERVAVLDTEAATTFLATLCEAHTGEPPNPVFRAPAAPRPSAPASEPAAMPPPTSDPATKFDADAAEPSDLSLGAPPPAVGGKPGVKASLRVLGAPVVEDLILPGRDLRGRAAELGVFLACHPDGADTETIAEYLVPDVRRRQAKQLVHTNASNLRHVLGRAAGPVTAGYVLKRGASARYRLDPTTVRVDLWQLRDLLTRAQLASAPARTDLLREACDLYTAPLADGCDYEWVEPHREKARQWGTEAHLRLADDLIESDPQAASDLLDKAIGLDRYNEQLYRKAMHARHALRDADGIRTLLRALTKALADLDAEPAETTVELATKLRTSLEQQ